MDVGKLCLPMKTKVKAFRLNNILLIFAFFNGDTQVNIFSDNTFCRNSALPPLPCISAHLDRVLLVYDIIPPSANV